MRTFLVYLTSLLIMVVILSCSSDKTAETEKPHSELEKEVVTIEPISIPGDAVETESGLKYIDQKIGEGAMPQKGQRVAAHYTGRLMDGSKFDSSFDRNEPLEFTCGVREMIAGFDEGVMTMKVGGKRTLYIPANLAYGESGIPNVIPPNSMIVFDVELVEIK